MFHWHLVLKEMARPSGVESVSNWDPSAHLYSTHVSYVSCNSLAGLIQVMEPSKPSCPLMIPLVGFSGG